MNLHDSEGAVKKALLSGVFDPVTNGHLWLVAKSIALDLFDKIVVGVMDDDTRNTAFTHEERANLWRENGEIIHRERIEVVALDNENPARAARRLGCQFLLRGIRSPQEYEAEVALQETNRSLEPMVQTVFLVPDPEVAVISASLVRGMIGKPGWKEGVKRYISVPTWEALLEKFGRKWERMS